MANCKESELADMNRTFYFNYCEEKLSTLCARIELRGQLNILDLHLHSEDFYAHLFNSMFGYSLQNMNAVCQNSEAIDLIDINSKILIQVSSTAKKEKIESALQKNLSQYKGNNFKFISIAKDASSLRGLTYKNPHGLIFHPSADIHDLKTILGTILHLDIEKQKAIYELIKNELGERSDALKVESNLAEIIGILAKEELSVPTEASPVAFNIENKLEFNNLTTAADLIEDYKVHHGRISKIYAEYDKAGKNKSMSVLGSLRTSYMTLSQHYSSDALFFQVIDEAMKKVKNSSNYNPIPDEELELCVSIIAVDAFIRCKIFKNPTKQNATA